ncbi:hypothetical protein [Niabella aquatica]
MKQISFEISEESIKKFIKLTVLMVVMLCQTLYYTYAKSGTINLAGYIDRNEVYLFYLHGGIVQEQGANAISKDFGRYEYHAILDSFKKEGFHVISEVRPRGTQEINYAKKVCRQIDSLLIKGISPKNIVVVGASQGGFITIEIAHLMRNNKINYVVLAICNEYNINYYKKIKKQLCGNFLSIFESSDSKKSCRELLGQSDCKNRFREVNLTMGNGHGFIFKPYDAWMKPISVWIKERSLNDED